MRRDMIEWRDWPPPATCGHGKPAKWPYVVAVIAGMAAIGGAETPAPVKPAAPHPPAPKPAAPHPAAHPAVHTVIVHAPPAPHPWLTGGQAVALVGIVCAALVLILVGRAALRHVFGNRG